MRIKKIVIMIIVVIAGFLIWRFFFYQAGNNGQTFSDTDSESVAPVKDGSIAPSQRDAYIKLQERWRENQRQSVKGGQ